MTSAPSASAPSAEERIPVGSRTAGMPPEITDLTSLKAGILAYLNSHEKTACAPVRHVHTRFYRPALKCGTTIRAVLDGMAAEGEIAIKYFETLRRTYVFPPGAYNMLLEAERSDPAFTWLEYSKILNQYAK